MLGGAARVAAAPAATPGEAATAKYFASIRSDPSLLLAFLAEMPKGGDLHNHLSGAIYAESYLRWAADDGLCVAVATLSIVDGTCDAGGGRPPAADAAPQQQRCSTRPSTRCRCGTGIRRSTATIISSRRSASSGPRLGRTGRHARRGRGACGGRARQLSRADGDARRRRRRGARDRGRLGSGPRRGCATQLLAAGFRDAVVERRPDPARSRRRRASATLLQVRNAPGQTPAAAPRPLHLPGRPRERAAVGVRPDARRVRDRDRGAARRQPEPGAARRRSRSRSATSRCRCRCSTTCTGSIRR